jgi:hypothetical protein
MHGRPQGVSGLRPHVTIRILRQQPHRDLDDIGLGGTTRALLAPIACRGVHGHEPHLRVGIVEVLQQGWDGFLVHEVVEDAATTCPNPRVGVSQPSSNGRRRVDSCGHQHARRGVAAVLDPELGYGSVVIGAHDGHDPPPSSSRDGNRRLSRRITRDRSDASRSLAAGRLHACPGGS